MNKQRRARVAEALKHLQDAKSILEEIASEEREAYDNMPEGLQNSERGEAAGNAADALESADSNVSDAIDSLEGIE